jgi:hypothetical protein
MKLVFYERQQLDGQSGDEMLAARANHRAEKRWRGLLPRLVLFILVAPPLQSRVVRPFTWYGVYGYPTIFR